MAKKRPAQVPLAGNTASKPVNEAQGTLTPADLPSTAQQYISEHEPQNAAQTALSATPQVEQRVVIAPNYPTWPSSRRGPQSTPPPPGMRSINPLRPEQVAEVGYNQETGEPGTQSPFRSLPDENQADPSFDQLETAQDAVRKRKKERL